jgi:hypothetical protein
MLEVCWRVDGISWRELEGGLKHATSFHDLHVAKVITTTFHVNKMAELLERKCNISGRCGWI